MTQMYAAATTTMVKAIPAATMAAAATVAAIADIDRTKLITPGHTSGGFLLHPIT